MSEFLQGFFIGIGFTIVVSSVFAFTFCHIAKKLNDENANDCV